MDACCENSEVEKVNNKEARMAAADFMGNGFMMDGIIP
jgi:hypothetical protein